MPQCIISGGVFIHSSMVGDSHMPSIVNITENAMVMPAVQCTRRCSSPYSPRANSRAAITPMPTDRPIKKPIMMIITKMLAPTAAAASLPRFCPTKIKSTVLYNCWIRLLANSGSENQNSGLAIGPRVKSLVFLPDKAFVLSS